jgi:hypothetical protein
MNPCAMPGCMLHPVLQPHLLQEQTDGEAGPFVVRFIRSAGDDLCETALHTVVDGSGLQGTCGKVHMHHGACAVPQSRLLEKGGSMQFHQVIIEQLTQLLDNGRCIRMQGLRVVVGDHSCELIIVYAINRRDDRITPPRMDDHAIQLGKGCRNSTPGPFRCGTIGRNSHIPGVVRPMTLPQSRPLSPAHARTLGPSGITAHDRNPGLQPSPIPPTP